MRPVGAVGADDVLSPVPVLSFPCSWPQLLKNSNAASTTTNLFISLITCRRRKRIGYGVVDRRQRLKISEDRFEVVIRHIPIPIPRHWRKNRPSCSLMFTGSKCIHEHF